MSTMVTDVLGADGFSVEIVGFADGEYIWDLDDYLYCRVVDVRIETITKYGNTRNVLVIEFEKDLPSIKMLRGE